MALWLYDNDPFESLSLRPSRILDQWFGSALDPEDLCSPITHKLCRKLTRTAPYQRPWRSRASHRDSGSTVNFGPGKFEANLDVQQFRPEEITVKVSENTITVEGKHEEKEDEHGYISRHFVRKYVLPKNHDVEKLESKLSSDGVLTITAPTIDADNKEEGRNIPIMHTGKPSKAVEQGKQQKMDEN